ncbi:MAG: PEP-CTERM sorting domain-containing protein [Phycisphaerae bacterium]|nr:PEP-CTERM sorting domain-containing protein [Phycisphaerae bacterium]
MKERARIPAICSVVVLAILGASTARAGQYDWDVGDGLFDAPASWDPSGPPLSGDTALFDLLGSRTVTFNSSPTNLSATVGSGHYDFNMQGNTYTLTSADSVIVGDQAGSIASLTLEGGTLAGEDGFIGHAGGADGTVTVDGAGSSWTNSQDLWVGDGGAGELNVVGGGSVSNAWGYLGHASGVIGRVTVDGAGSSWTNSVHIIAGFYGAGELSIVGGGSVSNRVCWIGYLEDSSGTVTVDGAGSSWTNSSALNVGNEGTGELNVVNGGSISNTTGYIGYAIGADGTVTVDGAGSSWTNSSALNVGNEGTGELNVVNGGSVSNTEGYIGYAGGAEGTATVDGAGSTWTNSGGLYVGGNETSSGGTGLLTVQNGGEVRVGETLKIWDTGTLNLNAGGAVAADALELVSGATFSQAAGSVLRLNTLSGFGDDPSFVASFHLGHAAGNTGAGTHTVSGAQSPTVGDDLVVGYDASGTLSIVGGGSVSGSNGYIGCEIGSDGAVTVDGDGSSWTNSDGLLVGNEGTGELNVVNGGLVEVGQTTYVSASAGSSGRINFNDGTLTTGGFMVDPADLSGEGVIHTNGLVSDVDLVFDAGHGLTQALMLNEPGQNITVNLDADGSGPMGVGYRGSGSMLISGGLDLESSAGCLGWQSGSSGAATVDGAGSTWTSSGGIYVGGSETSAGGTGLLTLQNSGVVQGGSLLKVWDAGTVDVINSGKVVVGGPAAAADGSLTIGSDAAGELSIVGGGGVSNTDGYVGLSVGASGTATVDGAGSTWTNSGGLYIGGDDTSAGGTGLLTLQNSGVVLAGSLLKVWDSGTVNVTSGQLFAGGSGFDLPGGWVLVGTDATGAMSIVGGGSVSSDKGIIAYLSGSDGTVTVDGAGSSWTNSSALNVGNEGTGELNVVSGGSVSNTDGYIGYAGSADGTATVDGAGSTWTNSGDLYIGGSSHSAGGTGELTVVNGGSVSNTNVWIGYARSSDGTVTVDGDGSSLTNSRYLIVGYSGTGELNVVSGGSVSTRYGRIGSASGADGTVTVDGDGSSWTNSDDLGIGDGGTGQLNVVSGGSVSNTHGYIGAFSDLGSTVTVDGDGSSWTNSRGLVVGYSGTGELNVVSGGSVSNTDGYIGSGYLVLMGDGTVTVDGAGSTWTNSRHLYVGYVGTGQLNVLNGGSVSNTEGRIGFYNIFETTVSDGTVTVDGDGSSWTNSSYLYVGSDSTGELNVLNGGSVSNTFGCIGFFDRFEITASDGTVTVDGAGSSWTNSSYLYVGDGGRAELNVVSGGSVSNTDGYIGYATGLEGNATVDGDGSSWANSSSLTVGKGGTGELNVVSGGSVSNTEGYIGYESGSDGTVTVDGAGSLWTNSGSLYIGGSSTLAGGTGVLAVSDGGTVDAIDTLNIWSGGTVNVSNGGTVNAIDTLRIWSGGTLNVSGGTVSAAAMVNDGGTLNFTSGTLHFTGDFSAGPGEFLGASPALGSGMTLSVAGTMTVGDASEVTLNGGRLSAGNLNLVGTLDFRSGVLEITGSAGLTIGPDGLLGSTVVMDEMRGLAVRHTVTIADGALLTIHGGTYAFGATDLDGGTLVTTSTLDVTTDQVISGHGTIYGPLDLDGGDVAGSGSGLKLYGDLSGSGSVSNTTVYGEISVGHSPGTMTFDNVNFGSGTILNMELAGTGLGQCDEIIFVGDAALGATLQVSLIDGFTPGIGDTFDILDFGELNGTEFDAIELPELAGRRAWDTSGLYSDGEISVIGMLDGDTDVDWDVDDTDYDTFVGAFGGPGDWHTDFNEDGMVDLEDFVLLRGNFGVNLAAPAPLPDATASTPEPATIVLLGLGGLAILRRRRR